MVKTNGKFLSETISSLGLNKKDKAKAIVNARNIVEKIIPNGRNGKGHSSIETKGIIGLVYGRIQSGKTRAMILSTALAFDNGVRIAVVLTSNINDLVAQTHLDFTRDLRGVTVFTKDDELNREVANAKLDIENPEGRILIISSKGAKSLKNLSTFLRKIRAGSYHMIILDDEGDQASLDTNTYRRSTNGNITLEPSSINRLIGKLRRDFSKSSVYISVTGTPQAVLLQSSSSDMKPSFVSMLPPGDGYIGGDFFFNTKEPEDNEHHLISVVPAADKSELINSGVPIPAGLKDSILFFLLSAAAATFNLGEKDKGYQFLCHPSLKNSEQDQAKDRISRFLTEIKRILLGHRDRLNINENLDNQYNELKKQLGDSTPTIEKLKSIINRELRRKKILVINAKNSKRHGIEYGHGFNFLIGGNTLGRGIAIPNLLVTYYIRSAKTSQIDTVHQHARMFGYREETIRYTRLFTPRNLYYRFRDIHYSDEGLRNFIAKHTDSMSPASFPVEFSNGLQPTRKNVLDVNTTDIIWPGMQIYPNYMRLPQTLKTYKYVMSLVATSLGINDWENNIKEMERKGKIGIIVTVNKAIQILLQIRTNSLSSWQDKTIEVVIKKIGQRLGGRIKLKFREAERTIGENGLLAQGTISGKEQRDSQLDSIPTLWIMSVTGKPESMIGANQTFAFPTIIVPNSMPSLFVFSKR